MSLKSGDLGLLAKTKCWGDTILQLGAVAKARRTCKHGGGKGGVTSKGNRDVNENGELNYTREGIFIHGGALAKASPKQDFCWGNPRPYRSLVMEGL